ncbi:EF-hand domain-containing family member B-like [Anthonomus grandis grandis]|uniref:EF-hand domain-containing family member B-like n=1 Tax=Anthonomus grandis grandis TaxID=2921223 RepID=UPI0021653969|nr:EF-hand domain-containing family member B-like [Anthonomus grandis grandis]
MAGNYGKFKDRSPIICAAGKSSGDVNENVPSVLKQYKVVDEIEALKHDAKIWKEEEFKLPRKLPPIQNKQFLGTNTEISTILRPPTMTRYQQLIQDLKDTPYSSYWNAQIGKSRDPTPGLPIGMIPVETTFGEPSKKDITVKELVNPPKGPYEVLRESQVGHEMYKKTHDDYNPSERICRGYRSPPYDSHKCFGGRTKYDPRGIWVKCACDWYKKEPLVHANKYQSDFFNRTKPQLGKVLAPNNNIDCVPKGHVFGDPSKQDFYTVEDLLKDSNVQPCVFKRDFYEWLASLNKVRILIKEKTKHGFNLQETFKRALHLDTLKSGLLPLEILYEIFGYYHILLPNELKYLCDHLNYISDGKVIYRKFIDLLDINKDPNDIRRIDDIPEKSKYYISTSQAASCDYLFINNTNLPPAGVPSVRQDLPRPVAPPGGCRADIENLGNESSAKSALNPSIYINYGLNYRDFFLPRSPEVMRSLFEKIGYNFPGDNFQKLWDMGVKIDRTGQVCVDTFKKLVQNRCPGLKLRVDEKQIECDRGFP